MTISKLEDMETRLGRCNRSELRDRIVVAFKAASAPLAFATLPTRATGFGAVGGATAPTNCNLIARRGSISPMPLTASCQLQSVALTISAQRGQPRVH